MMEFILILLSGLLWRLRGMLGAKFTVMFASIQAYLLWPLIGHWALAYGAWICVGELSGWKPKIIWDTGNWWKCAGMGFLIGGIGAIAVPAAVWIQRYIGEPKIRMLQNPRLFPRPSWDKSESLDWPEPKPLLSWKGTWNEVYFGVIFNLLLQIGIFIYDKFC